MRRKTDERSTEGNSSIQASVEVGYLYAGIEARLDAIATTPGGKRTALVVAEGLGNLLLAKTNGFLLHDTKRMSKVWGRPAQGHEEPAPAAEVHVRPRHKRTLRNGITCRVCGNRFPSQKKYMKHRYAEHPEIVKKQLIGLRKAMRRAA